MEELNDSGEDLFITQSTFRIESVNTQCAHEVANFLLDSDDDVLSMSFEKPKGTSTPEVVEYVDFTNQPDKTYTLLPTQEYEEKKNSEIFEPLLPNLFEFNNDKVPIAVMFCFHLCHYVSFYTICPKTLDSKLFSYLGH